MSEWSVTSFGTNAVNRLRIDFATRAVDKCAFEVAGIYDDEAPVAYGDVLTVSQDDTPWFVGPVNNIPRTASSQAEAINYELVGGWWYLQECTYQQAWSQWAQVEDPETEELVWTEVSQYKSRVILCQDDEGGPITTGAQIAACVQYCIDRGAPIAIGTIDAGIQIPAGEEIDISCADAMSRMLDWTPDQISWFDYSSGTPTFNCRLAANLTEVAIANTDAEKIDITPRYDLQIPGVILRYEQRNVSNGLVYNTITEDTAGTTDDLRTAISTIELAGSTLKMVTAHIKTEPFPTDLYSKAWWKKRVPALAGIDDANIVLSGPSRSIASEFQSTHLWILTEGVIPLWVPTSKVNPQEDTITINCKIIGDGGGTVTTDPRTTTCTVIDYDTGATNEHTFKTVDEWESAEAIPEGLAAALYAAWSQLQHDGSIVIVADEVAGTIRPGSRLNITGGVAAHTTMAAIVQNVSEDIDYGTTTITIGPGKHLGADSLLRLRKTTRFRIVARDYSERTTGQPAAGDTVDNQGGPTVKDKTSSAPGTTHKQTITSETEPQKIEQDPAQVDAVGKVAQVVEDGTYKVLKVQYAKLHS